MDLVITDIRMPVMDGAELALWLAEDRPSLPVIVMSAYADSGTVRELEAQGNHFLDKPLDFNRYDRTADAVAGHLAYRKTGCFLVEVEKHSCVVEHRYFHTRISY